MSDNPPDKIQPHVVIQGELYTFDGIKAIEYHPDGTVSRVEFFAPNDYPITQKLYIDIDKLLDTHDGSPE